MSDIDEHAATAPTFRDIAAFRLGGRSFDPDPALRADEQFHLSLASTEALSRWASGLKNAAGTAFRLSAGFLDDLRPNALADAWQSAHVIAMHTALFASISEFAFFCFAQRAFFADVGEAAQETPPAPWDGRVPGLWLLDFTVRGGAVNDMQARQLTPKDHDRYLAAIWLAHLMARFVWLHELAHCCNGHVGFAQRHNLAPRLYELADPTNLASVRAGRRDANDDKTLQCLEFDADRAALIGCVHIQRHDQELVEGIRRLDLKLRLRLTLFGAYAMVWLIEQFQAYLDGQDERSHPTPQLRLHNLFRTAAGDLAPSDPDFSSLHADVLRQFDAIRARLPEMYAETDLDARLRDPALMDALRSFDPTVRAIEVDLAAFAYR